MDTVGAIPAVALQLEELLDAFSRGIERFKDGLSSDTQHATLVYRRAGEWYVAEDKKQLQEAVAHLQRLYSRKVIFAQVS